MFKTAIVILNWNGLNWLKKFLGIVVTCSADQETVVYVADNGSTDGSAEWVKSSFRDIRIIKLEKNHGFADGYNLALAQIEAKFYVLLNSDVEVTSGWLKPLTRYMEDNPDVGSCQPKIMAYRDRQYFEYAGAAGGFIDKFGYTFCRGRVFSNVEKDNGQYDDTTDIFWSTGACMVIRAEVWRKCGGFDGDFFAHMEEIDLCWRMHKAGYRVVCVPDSAVYHVGGGMLPYESEYKTYLNFRNNLFMLYKNLPDIGLGSTMLIRRALDGLAALMFLFKGKFRNVKAVWNAHRDYHSSLNDLKRKRVLNREMTVSYPGNLIYGRSIIFQYYFAKRKTFSRLYNQK
jgi:GT2 family glycosyltransferase